MKNDHSEVHDKSQAAPSQSPPTPIFNRYEDYGCQVNALTPEELFRLYEQTGFLYEDKRRRLAPVMPKIKENWRRALRAGELLLWCATCSDEDSGGTATLSSWRTSHRGWISQHLASSAPPRCSLTLLLAGQAVALHRELDQSFQNWFRPENRYPSRVFGSATRTIGPELSSVASFDYLAVPKKGCRPAGSTCRIARCQNQASPELFEFASKTRGPVYAQAEDLDHADLLLDQVDDLYRMVGLRRYRSIWLAYRRGSDEIMGAAIAWRGPLGLNFSFLENRCDLLMASGLTDSEAMETSRSLVNAAASAYQEFELPYIPVVADSAATAGLMSVGAKPIRRYSQSVWLRPAFESCTDTRKSSIQRSSVPEAGADWAPLVNPSTPPPSNHA